MKIAIDFDCTLFPTVESVIEVYNRRYNDNISIDQLTKYSLYDSLDKDVADKMFDIFRDKETYENLKPYEYAVEAVKQLVNKGHEIFIATATDIASIGWKANLLQKYFPFIPKNNLIRINHKHLLKVDIIIDDYLVNLTDSSAEKICFNHVWNRDKDIDKKYNIHRVYAWNDVLDIINDIERKNKNE